MGMEIERKFLVKSMPEDLEKYPMRLLEQGYLNTNPVVRVRRDGEGCELTYKGKGLLAREEYNLPLDEASYQHLLEKCDGLILTKRRYEIPLTEALTAELDVFEGDYAGLMLVEVEFSSEKDAEAFQQPAWFGEDVTLSGKYANSRLSQGNF